MTLLTFKCSVLFTLYLWINFLILLLFEAQSYVVEAGFKLSVMQKMGPAFCSSCSYFPSARITGILHQAQLFYWILGFFLVLYWVSSYWLLQRCELAIEEFHRDSKGKSVQSVCSPNIVPSQQSKARKPGRVPHYLILYVPDLLGSRLWREVVWWHQWWEL